MEVTDGLCYSSSMETVPDKRRRLGVGFATPAVRPAGSVVSMSSVKTGIYEPAEASSAPPQV